MLVDDNVNANRGTVNLTPFGLFHQHAQHSVNDHSVLKFLVDSDNDSDGDENGYGDVEGLGKKFVA
jgi:hypothetical protein